MDRKSGLITLITAILVLTLNPGLFCFGEAWCEGWVINIARERT